jgi:hypothetical protein
MPDGAGRVGRISNTENGRPKGGSQPCPGFITNCPGSVAAAISGRQRRDVVVGRSRRLPILGVDIQAS